MSVVFVNSRSRPRAATACRPAKHPRITASSFPEGRHFSSWRMSVRFHTKDRSSEQLDSRCSSDPFQFDPFCTSSRPWLAQRSERFARLRWDPFFLLLAPFRSLSFPTSFLRVRLASLPSSEPPFVRWKGSKSATNVRSMHVAPTFVAMASIRGLTCPLPSSTPHVPCFENETAIPRRRVASETRPAEAAPRTSSAGIGRWMRGCVRRSPRIFANRPHASRTEGGPVGWDPRNGRLGRTETDPYEPLLARIKRRVNRRRDARRRAQEAHTARGRVVGRDTRAEEGCGWTQRRGKEVPSHRRVERRPHARRGVRADGIHVILRHRFAQAAAPGGRCSSCSRSQGTVRLVRPSPLVRARVSPRSHEPMRLATVATDTSVLVEAVRPPWILVDEKELLHVSRSSSTDLPFRNLFFVRKTSTGCDRDRSGTSSRWPSFRSGTNPKGRDV